MHFKSIINTDVAAKSRCRQNKELINVGLKQWMLLIGDQNLSYEHLDLKKHLIKYIFYKHHIDTHSHMQLAQITECHPLSFAWLTDHILLVLRYFSKRKSGLAMQDYIPFLLIRTFTFSVNMFQLYCPLTFIVSRVLANLQI